VQKFSPKGSDLQSSGRKLGIKTPFDKDYIQRRSGELERLCRRVFYLRQQSGKARGPLVNDFGFCDETSNCEVYCVGGYLFRPENVSRFEDEWNEIMLPLNARGIRAFHASDCAVGENEFANLSEAEGMVLMTPDFHYSASPVPSFLSS
jgi:hypothetical protein